MSSNVILDSLVPDIVKGKIEGFDTADALGNNQGYFEPLWFLR